MKKRFDLLFPLIFSTLIFLSVIIWLQLDSALPHWDMGRHLFSSIQYQKLWHDFFSGQKNIFGLLGMYYYYPPLVYHISAFFNFLFGTSEDVSVLSNYVWIFILVFSTYGIAKSLFSRSVAVASVIFLAAMPILIGQFREFQLDMPLTAIVALYHYFLMRTDFLKNKKFSLVLGLVLGLGMLTKWTFVIFIVPSSLVYLFCSFYKNPDKLIIAKNLFYILLMVLVVAGPWYYRNFNQIRLDFMQNGVKQAQIEGDPYGFNKDAFVWYFKNFSKFYLFLPLSVIFLFGFFRGFFFNSKRLIFLLLAGYIALIYLIVSALPNKDVRYIMPLAPFVSIVAVSFIYGLNKTFRIVSLAVILGIFLFNNAVVSFGQPLKLPNREIDLFNSTYFGRVYAQDGYTSSSPRKAVCPIDSIARVIPEEKTAMIFGQNTFEFGDWAVAYYLEKNNREWAGKDNIGGADYLIIKGDIPPVPLGFDLIKKVSCEDGSEVSIIKLIK